VLRLHIGVHAAVVVVVVVVVKVVKGKAIPLQAFQFPGG
jgi:hypothetical protein